MYDFMHRSSLPFVRIAPHWRTTTVADADSTTMASGFDALLMAADDLDPPSAPAAAPAAPAPAAAGRVRGGNADPYDAPGRADAGCTGPFGSKVPSSPWNELEAPRSRKIGERNYCCCVPGCDKYMTSRAKNYMCKAHFREYLAAGGSKGDIIATPNQAPSSSFPLESDDEDEDEDNAVGPTGDDAVDFSSADSIMSKKRQLEEMLNNHAKAPKSFKWRVNACGKVTKSGGKTVLSGGKGRKATDTEEPSPEAVEMWTSVSTALPANEKISEVYPQGISGIGRGELHSSAGKVKLQFIHSPVPGSRVWHDMDTKMAPVGFAGVGHLYQVDIGGAQHAMNVTIGVYETAAKARAAFALFRKTMVETLAEGFHKLSVINEKVLLALDGRLSLFSHDLNTLKMPSHLQPCFSTHTFSRQRCALARSHRVSQTATRRQEHCGDARANGNIGHSGLQGSCCVCACGCCRRWH